MHSRWALHAGKAIGLIKKTTTVFAQLRLWLLLGLKQITYPSFHASVTNENSLGAVWRICYLSFAFRDSWQHCLFCGVQYWQDIWRHVTFLDLWYSFLKALWLLHCRWRDHSNCWSLIKGIICASSPTALNSRSWNRSILVCGTWSSTNWPVWKEAFEVWLEQPEIWEQQPGPNIESFTEVRSTGDRRRWLVNLWFLLAIPCRNKLCFPCLSTIFFLHMHIAQF